MSGTDDETPNKEVFVTGLARGLSVLTAFSSAHPEMTITEVARATGLNAATARRCLLTLVHLGYARQDRGRFVLRAKVLELGASFTDATGLSDAVQPALETLRAETGDSASFTVLDGADILMVLHLPATRLIRDVSSNGARGAAYLVPTGRVLLAHLPDDELRRYLDTVQIEARTTNTVRSANALAKVLTQVRKQGYAVVVDEIEYGLTAMAVPVRLRDGTVVAGVGVAFVSNVQPLKEAVAFRLPLMRHAASQIEQQLSHFPALARALTPIQ